MPSKSPTFTSADDGSSVTVSSPTAPFFIRLKGNPTTGYSWMASPSTAEGPVNDDYVSTSRFSIRRKYEAPSRTLPGAAGEYVFMITPSEPLASGAHHQFTFAYARPWMLPATDKAYTLTVTYKK